MGRAIMGDIVPIGGTLCSFNVHVNLGTVICAFCPLRGDESWSGDMQRLQQLSANKAEVQQESNDAFSSNADKINLFLFWHLERKSRQL